jgi:4-hydroxy-tetrahydrodipicolinate reductase
MSARELQVAIFGASGRMGLAVVAAVEESSGAAVTGSTTSSGDPAAALRGADVAIEFALPQATAAHLAACVAAKRPIVIGTTGHDDAQRGQIAAAAREIAIVMAPNMSLGVNLLLKLVELTAGKLDASYDIEVFEAHHRNKKDAPSGTALALGAAAASGRGVKLSEVTEHARHGTGAGRERSDGIRAWSRAGGALACRSSTGPVFDAGRAGHQCHQSVDSHPLARGENLFAGSA